MTGGAAPPDGEPARALDRGLAGALTSWLGLRPATHRVRVTRDLPVVMRDGAVLRADRHHPAEDPAAPLVLLRTPYGRGLPFRALYGQLLAERGYQVVLQSCRGTGESQGRFDPFVERADGHDTVAWLRRQPWYPGRFATAGASYLGVTQWALADAAPNELAAMVVVAAASQPHGAVHPGGALALHTWLTWSARMADRGAWERGAAHVLAAVLRGGPRLRAALAHLPLAEADAVATGGARIPWWQEWLAEPDADAPAWRRRDASAAVPRTRAAVALVTGWDDLFLPGQLADWAALHRRDAPGDAGPHRLVVGPWGHGAVALMATGLRETVAWLDTHLQGRATAPGDAPGGAPGGAPVRYAVTEAADPAAGVLGRSRAALASDAPRSDAPRAVARRARWRETNRWPPPGVHRQAWHLQGPPAPGTTGRRGGLAPPTPLVGPPTLLHVDPADPTPTRGGPSLDDPRTRSDQAAVEQRDDVITFTSPPLQAPLELAGPVRAVVHVRADRPSVDVVARLCDVDPTGRSVHVSEGIRRVTDAHTAVRAAIVDLWPTAHRVAAGHRVRLQVAGAAFPRYARNPGTGEPHGQAARAQAITVAIHHDPEHPSHVLLPVQALAAAPVAATASAAGGRSGDLGDGLDLDR